MNVQSEKFGNLPDGREVQLFTLTSNTGMNVKITNYGVILTNITLPGKNVLRENIVCGFNKLENYTSDEYLGNYPCF